MNENPTIDTYLIVASGGIVKFSDWVMHGAFRPTKKPTPPLCKVYLKTYEHLRPEIKEYFENNKRVKGVIAFVGTEEQKNEILEKFTKKV